MNKIKALFFATIREKVGAKSIELETPDEMTVAQLKVKLSAEYPKLGDSMSSVLVSINHEFALDDEKIPAHAEVALFPPVSGG
ncbi:MAG: molybdopterin converting factor subunit 1 [Anaerolineales bacterium]|nr:molybdopterin converting factor subunit 1 [Anaerolineales bacterium]